MQILPETIGIDFTDERITGSAGALFLARIAGHLELRELLSRTIRLKKRRRGASDADTLLSLVHCLAQGDGTLSDVDRLATDDVRRDLLGLRRVPTSRRAGEYLGRFDDESVEALRKAAHRIARPVARDVIAHERKTKGYVPVFIDGTAIEVTGRYFEGAGKGYDGTEQYWLHGSWIGHLWAAQRLFPGGGDVAKDWRELLFETADLLGDAADVWARMDNAYYRKGVVDFCRARGWDYSVSVTHPVYKRPIVLRANAVPDWDWEPIAGDGTESATLVFHRPDGWKHDAAYLVIRSEYDGPQRLLSPRYTVILTSRPDLPLSEIVRRHRGKQGQETAQKGPLIDLDLHHPPCRGFFANRAYYTLGQIAQILLVAVQHLLLPEGAWRHRPRTIIRDLVRLPGRLVFHARRRVLRFAKTARRLDWIACAADRLDAMARSPG